MKHILFIYLYRDGGNFKNWGDVLLSNPDGLEISEVEESIRARLIDGAFFVAEDLGIPSLRFVEFYDEVDHGWHEFAGFEAYDGSNERDSATDLVTFLNRFEFPCEA